MVNDNLPDLKVFHRSLIFIWVAIISSVVIITLLAFTMQTMNVVTATPQAEAINQILFLIAVAIAFAILFFKRSLFLPEKIISTLPDNSPAVKTDFVLMRLRRNYITVWALGEAIALLGFIDYIFTGNNQYFLVYTVVSVYSVLVNMPRLIIAEKCIELIMETEPS